jgi:hypothetical protein
MSGVMLTILPMLTRPHPPSGDDPVNVTVFFVQATTENPVIDPKLAELAKEVQKRDPKLLGFKLVSSEAKAVPVGESMTFKLVDKQELKVKVEKPKDDNGRVSLTIKPPELGEVTYACSCEKFFPVVTPYRTATGGVLIVAVMAKPCTANPISSAGRRCPGASRRSCRPPCSCS